MVQRTPLYLTLPSDWQPVDDRLAIRDLCDGIPGVYGAGDLKVTQRGAGANMSIDAAAGAVAIAGTEVAFQGFYRCASTAVENIVIEAANATNPRRDLIVAYIQDKEYSGSTNSESAWLDVVKGTAASSPVDPAVPANGIAIARVAVAANATSVTNANITDLRSLNGQASKPRGLVRLTNGLMASKQYGVQTGPIGSDPMNLNGSNLTFAVPDDSRWLEYSTVARISSNLANVGVALTIYRDATPLVTLPFPGRLMTPNFPYAIFASAIDRPFAGTHTYLAKLEVTEGTGVATSGIASTCFLKDVGGAL